MSILGRLASLLSGGTDAPGSTAARPPTASDKPNAGEARRIVDQICTEASAQAQADGTWRTKLSASQRWLVLKTEPEAMQIAVLMAAVADGPALIDSYTASAWRTAAIRQDIVSQLLRRDLPLSPAVLATLLDAWLAQRYSIDFGFPGRPLLGALERHAESTALDPTLRSKLAALDARAHDRAMPGHPFSKAITEIVTRIAGLLDPASAPDQSLPIGPFAQSYTAAGAPLPASDRAAWLSLGQHCAEAGDKAKPSAKWRKAAEPLIDAVGKDRIASFIATTLAQAIPDPARPDASLDIAKGLLWLTPMLDDGDLAGAVGRIGETSFRKVSGVGARAIKLGNAALLTLSEMAEHPRAIAELFRLREQIKYPSVRTIISARIAEVAAATGQSVEAMEDTALPSFGLGENGIVKIQFGQSRAEIVVSATETLTQWFSETGTPVKSIPAGVRAQHADALKAFQAAEKDIEATRVAQVRRLEQSWLEGRQWRFADWQQHFLHHPLRRPLVIALLWHVAGRAGLPTGEQLTDDSGDHFAPAADALIRLWHPLDSPPETVLRWRQHILDLGFTQPIKQAHREIYVLTDAERQTGTYSNRFAAHILRQHQFRALCQARGWKYDLMGAWDSWNVPTRYLPAHGMTVEYQVEAITDERLSDAHVPLYLASDQVRFLDAQQQPVALETLAPVVFSEVLRDVDLFVAVTSVANDPAWTDGGPDGRHGGYWHEWAFGELGQSATTRRELIAALRPRLSIADKLEITDKALVVQGKRHKYAIHFGSSNIQILPFNRYLCIVPDRAPAETAGLKLPFAGDGLLSTILAKAFLLVDEDKIKDSTIRRQL